MSDKSVKIAVAVIAGGAAAAAASSYYYYYYCNTMAPVQLPMDPEKHTKSLPDGSRIVTTLKDDQIIERYFEDVSTMYDAFLRGARISGKCDCLGVRNGKQYVWINYDDAYSTMCEWGSGLRCKGITPGSFIGIYGKNCPEWILAEYGGFTQSLVTVPLYDTLGPDVSTYCINHTELKVVVCDSEDKLKNLLNNASKTPSLSLIIHFNSISEESKKMAEEKEIELTSFQEVVAIGKKNPHEVKPPKPEDLALIMYTSGTTGVPKGVMLSHRNVVTVASSAISCLGSSTFLDNDCFISFLPLAHAFEQNMELAAFMSGSSVGFLSGSVAQLGEDYQALKPTISPMVPRLLNKIYDKAMGAVQRSPIKKKLLLMALASKKQELERNIIRRNTIWDKIIFRKLQKAFGNRIRIMVSGSAPIASDILNFIRCAFGCMVLEGYGQTESGGASTMTIPGDMSISHVGAPLPCSYVKLIDVPEMDYFSSENKGEICIKGPHVMVGYYQDLKKTSEAIDEDGWLHTGDVGRWLPNGALKIIDRKKNIFKLSQGEYIAPEKIENIYIRSKYVAQVFVHGESLQSCLIGIIVPDEQASVSWKKTNDSDEQNFQQLCQNRKFKKEIMEDLLKLGKAARLHSFEQVKDIYLSQELFTTENNLLTAVLKNKRTEIKKTFLQQIQEMYNSLG